MSLVDLGIGFVLGGCVVTIVLDIVVNRRKNNPPVPPPTLIPPVEPLRGTATPPSVRVTGRYSSPLSEGLREAQIGESLRHASIVPNFVKAQVAGAIRLEVKAGPKDSHRKILIQSCKDPLMWYADKIGQSFSYIAIWPESGWAVRDPVGFSNVVRFDEGILVLEVKEPE